MQDIIFILFFYILIATPAMIAIYAIYDFGIKKISNHRVRVPITSFLLIIVFTPMLSGGGAGLISYPAPSYMHVLEVIFYGQIDSFTWHLSNKPIFFYTSLFFTAIVSIGISIKLNPNKSFKPTPKSGAV